MKNQIPGTVLMAAALLAGAAAASTKASANLPQSDSGIAKNVRHEVAMYPGTAFGTPQFPRGRCNISLAANRAPGPGRPGCNQRHQ